MEGEMKRSHKKEERRGDNKERKEDKQRMRKRETNFIIIQCERLSFVIVLCAYVYSNCITHSVFFSGKTLVVHSVSKTNYKLWR